MPPQVGSELCELVLNDISVVRSIESGKDEAPKEVVQLAMKDQKFRLTRGKDGQKTNYQVLDNKIQFWTTVFKNMSIINMSISVTQQ